MKIPAVTVTSKSGSGLSASPHLLKSWIIPFLIAVIAIFSYLNGINGEFVFDDIPIIQLDSFYTDQDTSIVDCWNRSYWPSGMEIGQHRPLTILSFLLNTRIAGLSPVAFRIFNILLHAAVALLVFRLAVVLGLGRILAIFAGILFAVHPLHTEAVIPATGRAELLCAFFVVIGLIIHISSYRYHNLAGKRVKWKYHILTAFALLLACWSKENGVILLPLCLLYDIIFQIKKPEKEEWKKQIFSFIRRYSLSAAAMIVVIITRISGTGLLIPNVAGTDLYVDNPLIGVPLITRIITAMHIQGMVIIKFFWPQILAHDYSYAQILPTGNPGDLYANLALFSFIILPLILFYLMPFRRKMVLFLFGSYIISILPAGNFITPAGTIFGERLYYTPSVWLLFISLMLLFFITKRIRKQIPSAGIFLYILLAAAVTASLFRVYIRSEDWRNQWTLALSAVEVSPHSIKTWNNLAKELGRKGEYNKAVEACNRGLRIKAADNSLLTNRIYFYIAAKRYQEAEKALREVISLGSEDPEMFNFLGGILAGEGNIDEAKRYWRHSLKIKPDQPAIIDALK
jgi:Flp pilus assembly protein TadD